MFTSNKAFCTFNCPQKSFVFVGVNCVLNVLFVRNQFQISNPIVAAIKVFMVDLQTAINWPVKRFPYHTMYAMSCVFSVFAQVNNVVSFNQSWFQNSVQRITSPSFTQLDRMSRGYASAQKLSNLFKGKSVVKHLFSFRNFGGIKFFASSNTSHVSKITNLIQSFKAQNWVPCFHSFTPFNMNRSIA